MNSIICVAISSLLCLSAIYILSTTQEIVGVDVNNNVINQQKSHAVSSLLDKQEDGIESKKSIKEVKDININEELQNIVNKWKDKAKSIAKSQSKIYKKKYNHKTDRLPDKKDFPFVFFHQRKAGGTSFKEHLYKQSNKKYKSSYITGYDVQWGSFTVPNPSDQKKESYDVYAGHFNYMHVYSNIAIKDAKTVLKMNKEINNEEESTIPFSCIINARPTIERVFSCFNYFFLQELKLNDILPNAYNMTSSQWNKYLPILYSKFHQGCNNEFVRNFADNNNEMLINNMFVSDEDSSNTMNILLQNVLETVLSRVSQCTIMLLPKCTESVRVTQYYHPWLEMTDEYCNHKFNVGKEDPTTTPTTTNATTTIDSNPTSSNDGVPIDVQNVISKFNKLDDLVYEYLEVLFDEQYKISREVY